MGGDKLLDQIFNLKFTSKQLVKSSSKCEKEEKAEKLKVCDPPHTSAPAGKIGLSINTGRLDDRAPTCLRIYCKCGHRRQARTSTAQLCRAEHAGLRRAASLLTCAPLAPLPR
jgi:hypothetical protein